MTNLNDEEKRQEYEVWAKKASAMLNDKNRIAKAIAVFIRNKMENFHMKYVSDVQMRNLNPLIRNAIFTFLCDYGNNYASIATSSNESLCSEYILKNTFTYLQKQEIPVQGIKEFKTIITNEVGIPLKDLSKGGIMLIIYEQTYVPDYWEDCIYCRNLK